MSTLACINKSLGNSSKNFLGKKLPPQPLEERPLLPMMECKKWAVNYDAVFAALEAIPSLQLGIL